MIPIPYEQVDEFLRWLTERHPEAGSQSAESEDVKEVLTEYLKTRGRVDALTPSYALRIFQTCPMMYERSVRDQMEHFVGCGGCLHYIHERQQQYPRWLELHPLLQNFLRFCEQSRWGEILESSAQALDTSWLGEGKEYISHFFREYIHAMGGDLSQAFGEFIETADPALVNDYETNRVEWMRFPQRPLKPSKDWTEPLAISEGLDEASERLIGSVYLLLEGHFYKQARENPRVYRLMESLGLLSKNASRGVEFFLWSKEKFPDLDLFGSVPREEIVELALSFCEEKGISDAKSFSQEVMNWIRGNAEQPVLRRLAAMLENSKDETRKRASLTSQRQNGAALYHAMFLYQSSSDFPAFISRYWKDLNRAADANLNLYYSLEDLERKSLDPEIISQIKGLRLQSASLPALLLWKGSLSDSRILPLVKLSHEEIFGLMKLLLRKIAESTEFAEIIPEARAFIEKKLSTSLQIPSIIKDNGGLTLKDKASHSKAEDERSVDGRVFADRSDYLVAALKEAGLSDLAQTLKTAQDAIKSSGNIPPEQKTECVEIINQIGEEAAKPAPNNSLLKILSEGLKTGLETVRDVAAAVDAIPEALRRREQPVDQKARELDALVQRLEEKEKAQRRNALIYVGLPLIVGLALTVFAFWQAQNLKLITQTLQSAQQAAMTQKMELESAKAQLSRLNAASNQIRLGVSQFYSKNYSAAIAAYDKAIELDPTNAVTFDLKGYCLLRAGDSERAIDVLKQAVAIDRRYLWAHYDLALAYWAAGDTSSAVAEVRQLIALEPTFRDVIKTDAQFSKFRTSSEYRSLIGQ
jgi:tetratricopeptide (TPR) repeat protein